MNTKQDHIVNFIIGFFLAMLVYLSIATVIWEFRNPKANKMTVYTHFSDVIKFNKLEKFQ